MQKITCLILISFLSITACNLNTHPLGNNLVLWEGDVKEDRVVAYCEGDCRGGIYVVPSYKRHYDSIGNYAEFADSAKADSKWVIVKTIHSQSKKTNYWIIQKGFDITNLDCSKANCDSILQSHVQGPFSLADFNNKRQALNIDLSFK